MVIEEKSMFSFYVVGRNKFSRNEFQSYLPRLFMVKIPLNRPKNLISHLVFGVHNLTRLLPSNTFSFKFIWLNLKSSLFICLVFWITDLRLTHAPGLLWSEGALFSCFAGKIKIVAYFLQD